MTTLSLAGVTVARGGGTRIVDDVTFELRPSTIQGLVGESGSGKSTIGLAAAGALRAGTVLEHGYVCLGSEMIASARRGTDRRAPTGHVGVVPQHPAASLNPALRVERLLGSVLASRGVARPAISDAIAAVLTDVALPTTDEFRRRYPHQLSGGQLERVAIASALIGSPQAVIFDEPTSGLDAAHRSRLAALVRRLCRERGLAVLWISHDLSTLGAAADRIAVLYGGHIVEEGPSREIIDRPAHPYTQHLVAAIPRRGRRPSGLAGRVPLPGDRPTGCRFGARCALADDACRRGPIPLLDVGDDHRARCLHAYAVPAPLVGRPRDRGTRGSDDRWTAPVSMPVVLELRDVSASRAGRIVVRPTSLQVHEGEWLAMVGPSGAGKTTLLRTIAGLHPECRGTICLGDTVLAPTARRRCRSERVAIHLLSQHTRLAFNPRRTVGASISRPYLVGGGDRASARDAVREAAQRVALEPELVERLPAELSGGELQRAALARAIVGRPRVLLCDEVTRSLDGLLQATIVELLDRVRHELGIAIVFVAHDHGVVESCSDRTAVIVDGALVDLGVTEEVFARSSLQAASASLAEDA